MTGIPKPGDGGLNRDDLVSTGKPSLGDLAVVSRLVREFVKFVLDTRAAWHAGEKGARDPLAMIEAEARQLGDIFLGRDVRFDAQPWNTDNRLGMVMRVLLPDETKHYGDPGAAPFMWLAAQAAEAAAFIEQGSDEVEARERLDRIVTDVTERLLGTRY
ncbi:hypothetical protein [Paraburkholderia hospita]|uniref:hypothetical protein n=1 Tax=Paraburkholderia hospita TaxID=169430 RepID=UPI000271BFD9|nr:hypothetical protein [Paraburkholderia hospita]EUC21476.1 hypothetical protein PMI06_009192 [Burkholderia sp. BT03]SKC95316.1 hypothetical protein SAMN06266956_6893 [Paraburkholderia hospita]